MGIFKASDREALTRLPADLVESDIDAIDLQRIDEATAVARPREVETFYVEAELDELGKAQPTAWRAKGDAASRVDEISARAAEAAADDQTEILDIDKELTKDSANNLRQVRRALGPYARRTRKDKTLYYVMTAGLVGGDIAGITGAAISLGELPVLAGAQGIAAGFAALSAGVMGGELRDIRDARRRKKDLAPLADKPTSELTPTEQAQLAYAHEFAGADPGEGVARLVFCAGLSITMLVATSIFGLRASVNGPMVGLVYGALAAAIALASAMNGYAYANSASDLIQSHLNTYLKDRERLIASSRGGPRAEHARSAAAAKSIRAEHERLGEAARQKLASLKYRVLRSNPSVAGHGMAQGVSTGPAKLRLLGTQREMPEIAMHPSCGPDGDGKRPGAG